MKYKVIFDTNAIRNAKSISHFLGGRTELERFVKVTDIIIPDLVIEEIKTQKSENLNKYKKEFLENPFYSLLGIDENEVKTFSIDKYISELIDDEKIPYTVISINNTKLGTRI